jgi:hypothetical protein
MKITKVIRTRSAQCFPQVVDLAHFRSFDLLPSGCIVATSLDGKSGEVFRSWDSANFETPQPKLAEVIPVPEVLPQPAPQPSPPAPVYRSAKPVKR